MLSHQHLALEDYLLSVHLELGSLVSRPLDYCQGCQKAVLLQPGGVWSRKICALLGSI